MTKCQKTHPNYGVLDSEMAVACGLPVPPENPYPARHQVKKTTKRSLFFKSHANCMVPAFGPSTKPMICVFSPVCCFKPPKTLHGRLTMLQYEVSRCSTLYYSLSVPFCAGRAPAKGQFIRRPKEIGIYPSTFPQQEINHPRSHRIGQHSAIWQIIFSSCPA